MLSLNFHDMAQTENRAQTKIVGLDQQWFSQWGRLIFFFLRGSKNLASWQPDFISVCCSILPVG